MSALEKLKSKPFAERSYIEKAIVELWKYDGREWIGSQAAEEHAVLQSRFDAMSENYGSAVLEIEKLKALLVDLDRMNREARVEDGYHLWGTIYQERIDEALGVLPFDTPSADEVSEDEIRRN